MESIRLTDEILKKNGWKLITIPGLSSETEDWFIREKDDVDEVPFRLQRGYDGNAYWICVGMGGNLTPINTVQELQLAYDLCKINVKVKF